MREEIIRRLHELQDLKYREFHGGLCPGTNSIIGVRTPEMRKLAREIVKDGKVVEFLNEVENEYYEETLLEGLVIAGMKAPLEERLELLRRFVPKIDNWAACDLVCSSFKFSERELDKVWDFVMQYAKSKKEFELRFMFVMMMDYFLNEKYLTRVLKEVDAVRSEDYYVKMAQAWLISVAFVKFRKEALEFLRKNDLLGWVQNKAIQKIRESYRVSAENKKLVLEYKR